MFPLFQLQYSGSSISNVSPTLLHIFMLPIVGIEISKDFINEDIPFQHWSRFKDMNDDQGIFQILKFIQEVCEKKTRK